MPLSWARPAAAPAVKGKGVNISSFRFAPFRYPSHPLRALDLRHRQGVLLEIAKRSGHMLDKLLSRVDPGRLGRGLAGLRQGWQFQVVERSAAAVKGMVSYSGQGSAARKQKHYLVEIRFTGNGARASCNCPDWCSRQQPCIHIAIVAALELGFAAKCRSEHKDVPQVGAGV